MSVAHNIIFHYVGTKVMIGAYSIALTMLGVAEATNDHTLILISLMGNATLLVVTLIGAAVSVLNNRKLKVTEDKVTVLAALPEKVEELRKSTDGLLDKLTASRLETSEAKQDSARAEGVQQERVEQRERVAETIITHPTEVKIVNQESNPVPSKLVRKPETGPVK